MWNIGSFLVQQSIIGYKPAWVLKSWVICLWFTLTVLSKLVCLFILGVSFDCSLLCMFFSPLFCLVISDFVQLGATRQTLMQKKDGSNLLMLLLKWFHWIRKESFLYYGEIQLKRNAGISILWSQLCIDIASLKETKKVPPMWLGEYKLHGQNMMCQKSKPNQIWGTSCSSRRH